MQTTLLLDRGATARGSRLLVASEQDVEPVLERNAALRRERQPSDWGRHVASVPNVILVRWLNEEWACGNTELRLFSPQFNAMVAKKLADADWAYLRTTD
jgi:hypothetical protein